jgi:hypothetical protein
VLFQVVERPASPMSCVVEIETNTMWELQTRLQHYRKMTARLQQEPDLPFVEERRHRSKVGYLRSVSEKDAKEREGRCAKQTEVFRCDYAIVIALIWNVRLHLPFALPLPSA